MKKTRTNLLLFLVIAISLISVASAEIMLSQPNYLYSAGDELSLTVTLKPRKDTSAFFTAALNCNNASVEIYRAPVSLASGEQKEIQITTLLENFLISGLEGSCFVQVNYDAEFSQSQRFEISREIDVTLSVSNAVAEPGARISLSGAATKTSAQPLDGFVEISIPPLNFNFIGSTANGQFNTSFLVPPNFPAGTYAVQARAYEKDADGNILNEGKISAQIRVVQIMKGLSIALEKDSVQPPAILIFTPLVYDQAQNTMSSDVAVTIFDANKNTVSKNIVRSGEQRQIKLVGNATPGAWEISAKINEFETTKILFVEELRTVSFLLGGQTLAIINTGNVPFTGPVEVSIGAVNEIIELNSLAVGATKKFRLVAPDGNYEISVGDGSSVESLGNAALTGNAVSVEDLDRALGGKLLWVIWLIVILLALALAIYFYRKIAKKRFIKKAPWSFTQQSSGMARSAISSDAGSQNPASGGSRQEAVVISLYLRNIEELQNLNSPGLEAIDRALMKAKDAGAKIYTEGAFRVIVLTSQLTNEKDLATKSLIVAQNVERILVEHNRRSPAKVQFGLGVGLGELIVETIGGKFKFTSVDNLLVSVKRMSSTTRGIVISEKLHRLTAGKVKAAKRPDNSWEVQKITDRSEHSEFISKFKQRQKDSR